MNKTPVLQAILSFATLGALAGCMATRQPQPLSPDMMPQSFVGPRTDGAPIWPDARWWERFGDEELTSLVRRAQSDNRDISAAAARVLQARAQTTIQRSPLFPQVGADMGHINNGCKGDSCLFYNETPDYGLTVSTSYQLDFWGLARDNLRAANDQLKATRFSQQSVALTVTANVVNKYLSVLAVRGRMAILNEDIDAINRITELIQLKVKAGAASNLDLAREHAQMEDVHAQLQRLQIQEKQTLYSLAVLLGGTPEGFDVKGQNLLNVLAPAVGPGLPADLLLRRPDVASAEARLASAHASIDAARAAFFPQISLTGEGGVVSAAVGSLLHRASFGYEYGVDLLQTVFDGGKLIGQKRLAEGNEKELVATYQGSVLNAYADVESALVEVANTRKAEEHLRSEVDAASEAFEISQLQYRQGAADLLTVLQAQQTLFSAEDLLAQTALATRQAAVHLYEALGGGWEEGRGRA